MPQINIFRACPHIYPTPIYQIVKLSNQPVHRLSFGHKGRYERENAILAERKNAQTPTVCLLPLTFVRPDANPCAQEKTLVNETEYFHDILLPLFCPPKSHQSASKGYPAHVCMSLSPRPYTVMRSFPESPAEKKSVFQPNEKMNRLKLILNFASGK